MKDCISTENKIAKVSTLTGQVAQDIEKYLSQFSNRSFAIKTLAKSACLSEKTVRRLIEKKNIPSYQTLYCLYMEFYNTSDASVVREQSPQVVKDVLEKGEYKETNRKKGRSCSVGFYELLKSEPICIELFILAGTAPLHKSVVSYRYGEFGARCLKKLIDIDALSEVSKGVYIVNQDGPHLNGEAMKLVGLRLVEQFFKTGDAELQGNNVLSVYAEGLNEKGIKEWLKVDEKAYREKVELSQKKELRGDIPTFSFSAIDTVSYEGSK